METYNGSAPGLVMELVLHTSQLECQKSATASSKSWGENTLECCFPSLGLNFLLKWEYSDNFTISFFISKMGVIILS